MKRLIDRKLVSCLDDLFVSDTQTTLDAPEVKLFKMILLGTLFQFHVRH